RPCRAATSSSSPVNSNPETFESHLRPDSQAPSDSGQPGNALVPVTVGAMPGLGDLLRYTVSPLLGWLQMPLIKWQMFSPMKVPSRFKEEYSTGMALRPSQIRATSGDGALM